MLFPGPASDGMRTSAERLPIGAICEICGPNRRFQADAVNNLPSMLRTSKGKRDSHPDKARLAFSKPSGHLSRNAAHACS